MNHIPIIGAGRLAEPDNRLKEGDVRIDVNGDQIVMRECVVITRVMIAEQAAALGEAYATNLGRAAQDVLRLRQAVLQPTVAPGANGNGVVH